VHAGFALQESACGRIRHNDFPAAFARKRAPTAGNWIVRCPPCSRASELLQRASISNSCRVRRCAPFEAGGLSVYTAHNKIPGNKIPSNTVDSSRRRLRSRNVPIPIRLRSNLFLVFDHQFMAKN